MIVLDEEVGSTAQFAPFTLEAVGLDFLRYQRIENAGDLLEDVLRRTIAANLMKLRAVLIVRDDRL